MADELIERLRSGHTPTVNGRLVSWPEQCSEAADRIEALEAGIELLADNLALVVNHASLPDQYYHKFLSDLTDARAAIARAERTGGDND